MLLFIVTGLALAGSPEVPAGEASPVPATEELPAVDEAPAVDVPAPGEVPERMLAEGAVLTWAVEKGDGQGNDYEFVITLETLEGGLEYTWRMGPPKDEAGRRRVEPRWLQSATLVDNQYREGKKARFSSTSLVVSRTILDKARAGEPQTFAVGGGPPREIMSVSRVPFEVTIDDATVVLPALALSDKRGGVTTVLDHDTFPAIIAVEAAVHSALIAVRGAAPTVREALDETGTVTSYGVRFEIGSALLTPESHAVLSAVTEWLGDNADKTLRIEGHTDAVGPESSNQALSEARAAAVRAWLIEHGVEASRLAAVGLGEGTPVASNDTLAGRARNRRVVFTAE